MTFENSKYNLQEGEEKVLNLMSQPSYSMWVNSISRITSQKEINFNNKQIPIEEATSMLVSENYKNRRIIDKKVKEQLATVADFAEAEINAVYTSKKIEDELRGLEKPYSSTVLQYENEEETVENLVKVVTDNAKISKKFYRLKAKMLKQDKLSYCDRAASVGKISRSFDFKETVKILQNSFRKISPKYEEIFNRFLENGQINVYPKKGKSGGAYCFGSIGSPTFVLLNHTNDLNSVTTLAHEMGHAFHTELSNTQDPIYSDYTTSVAEVASTFFENFVFEELMESLTKKEQTIALHDKISGEISTIFRQIACFNFENELHKNIREKGYLAKEEIAKLMNKNMKAYLGPIVKFEEDDGYQFITWSHIRRFFYVYTYASGSLISSALFAKYKEDPKYLEKIEEFLSAGSSKNPEDIFASAGIDIRNPDFFRIGLEKIENDIKKLEKLIG
jgi:oligoendopeptidase F